LLVHGLIDDPLLKFAEHIQGGIEETVNLSPFFSAGGAVNDASRTTASPEAVLTNRLQNAETVANAAEAFDWQPQMPQPSLRSGILLLEARRAKPRSLSPELLRCHFHNSGIELTAYEHGLDRLAMPADKLEPAALDWLFMALQNVA